MRKIYILLFLMLFSFLQAQIINIPDANFKAKLLQADVVNSIAQDVSYNNIKIDVNNDGEIEVSEALLVSHLNISSSNINNLDGIENFTNIRGLNFSQNNIIDVNLNDNLILSQLDCSFNNITTLNFPNNTNLKYLNCSYNSIVSLDLSYNPLISLDCSNNELVFLNVKNGSALSMFLTTFEFGNNPNLEYICTDVNAISGTIMKVNSYGYTSCNVGDYCNFIPSGIYNVVQGNIKYDFDNNGCDIMDLNFLDLFFSIDNGSSSYIYIPNSIGNYNLFLINGNYTVTTNMENPSYFNITPTNISFNFPTVSSPLTQDFCVTANGIKSDVEVILVPIGRPRPGHQVSYRIIYRNKGTEIENGSVTLSYDNAILVYDYSIPSFNNSTTNSFTWNYTNLQPFETREVGVVFDLNSPTDSPPVNVDDILSFTTSITTSNTDETPLDNLFLLNQVVVNSYDPNDKTCLQGEAVEPSMIGEYVHYVIRFENTGTAAAQNIVVKDMIDLAKFDITTLVPLKGSHHYFTRINGNKVEFIFENINLDFNDATNDGYVAFKIKTLPTLNIGDTFSNDANIYFDYNFPITTNTYTTTIAALSNQNFEFDSQFILYPNPSIAILNIQSKNSLEIQSIEIYNILGQVVVAIPNATNAIDVSSLKTGTYFVKVNTNNGSANTKFVKE